MVPKLLVTHEDKDIAPFIDATGAHAGALLGDVKHDPFQSGGLETPAHERLEVGAIHKASKGVLFIDEINMLRMESQQSLLTALQEGKFSITGQSERSSGAMVKSEAVPCDFILVCAGNMDAMQGMHPALRSRIRGYGYEVYMRSTMDDTEENREKLVRFVAQEVAKDKKIPHFDKKAVGEIIKEAQSRAGRQGPADPAAAGAGRPDPRLRGHRPGGEQPGRHPGARHRRPRRSPAAWSSRSSTATSRRARTTDLRHRGRRGRRRQRTGGHELRLIACPSFPASSCRSWPRSPRRRPRTAARSSPPASWARSPRKRCRTSPPSSRSTPARTSATTTCTSSSSEPTMAWRAIPPPYPSPRRSYPPWRTSRWTRRSP